MSTKLHGFLLVAVAIGLSCGCGSEPSRSAAPAPSDGGETSVAGAGGSGEEAGGGAGGSGEEAGGPGAGGAASDGSASGTAGASGSSAVMLDQTGNPVHAKIATYGTWLSSAGDAAAKLAADQTLADHMITWQLPHGGFYKNARTVYAAPWNGTDPRSGWTGANGVELGTIDNAATVTELMFLADVYRRSGAAKYRDAVRGAFDFLLTMQYPSGGVAQVYPARTGTVYSNYVTFNDDAMVRALLVLDGATKLSPPLGGDVLSPAQRQQAAEAVANGIDFILKSQILQDGIRTVWCAQHDPVTYEPMGARSYELASKSGKESAGIIEFLMTQPQTEEIKASVQAAIAWYKSDPVGLPDTAYVKRASASTDDTYNPILPSPGKTMWYRFYDLDQDVGFFSGRLPTDNPPGVGKKYDIMEIEPERRYGYEWGGAYGTQLFTYTDRVGY